MIWLSLAAPWSCTPWPCFAAVSPSEGQGRREIWVVNCVNNCSAYLSPALSCAHNVFLPAVAHCDWHQEWHRKGRVRSTSNCSESPHPIPQGSRVSTTLTIPSLLCDGGLRWWWDFLIINLISNPGLSLLGQLMSSPWGVPSAGTNKV